MGPKRIPEWDHNGSRNGPKTGPKMAPGIAATKADPGNVPKTDAGILHGRVIALRARETYKNHFECPVMFDGNSSREAVNRSFLCRNIHTHPFGFMKIRKSMKIRSSISTPNGWISLIFVKCKGGHGT